MNKNTVRAKKAGYCSMDDANRDGNRIFKGKTCDTAWDAPLSNKRCKKIYRTKNEQ